MTGFQLQPQRFWIMIDHELKRLVLIKVFEQLKDDRVPIARVNVGDLDDTFVSIAVQHALTHGSAAHRIRVGVRGLARHSMDAKVKRRQAPDCLFGKLLFQQTMHE